MTQVACDTKELNVLISELEFLLDTHNSLISKEELQQVLDWCYQYNNGDNDARRKLKKEGLNNLLSFKDRIKLSLDEQHRIIEESPKVVARKEGKQDELAHHYNNVSRSIEHFCDFMKIQYDKT